MLTLRQILESTEPTQEFSVQEVRKLGLSLNIDFQRIPFAEFYVGIHVELEHGKKFPQTNITNDNPLETAKIAQIHLQENPRYYTGLRNVDKDVNLLFMKLLPNLNESFANGKVEKEDKLSKEEINRRYNLGIIFNEYEPKKDRTWLWGYEGKDKLKEGLDVPNVEQKKEGTCGPASLEAILKYFGIKIPEKTLANMSDTTKKEGTTPQKLLKTAKKFGLEGAVKDNLNYKSLAELIGKGYVAIVDWFSETEGHYSVVTAVKENSITIMDPEFGKKRTLSREDFENTWFDFSGKPPGGKLIKKSAVFLRPEKTKKENKEMLLKTILESTKARIKPDVRMKINSDLNTLTYNILFDEIPLDAIAEILQKRGLVLINEDGTEFGWLQKGRDHYTIYLGLFDNYNEKTKEYTIIENSVLLLRQQKTKEGKFLITAQIS